MLGQKQRVSQSCNLSGWQRELRGEFLLSSHTHTQDTSGWGGKVGGGGDLYCPSKQDRPGQGEEVGGGGDLYCPSKQDRWEVVVIFTVQADKTGGRWW